MSHNPLVQRIDSLLLRHTHIWRSNAYQLSTPVYLHKLPALCAFLLQLDDSQVQLLQGDDIALLSAISPYFDDATAIRELIAPYQGPALSTPIEPPAGVPGRKWQQITAFCEAQSSPQGLVLEWCSGKSYLGKAIQQRSGQNVLALEIDPHLVEAGNRVAATTHQIQQCDVLSEQVWPYISREIRRTIALHACGGLHQRLLYCASKRQCPEIALAPCCYHRFIESYQPLSQRLQFTRLQLDKADLRTAVRQSCTAHQGEIHARRKLQCAQLAFRILLQDNQLDSNMPLPSLSLRWAKSSYEQLFQHYSDQKAPAIHYKKSVKEYEKAGAALLARAERLELARMAFRRLIELRCVLDSILFLEEQNYHCTLAAFCHPSITPRNLLIFARRRTQPKK